MDIVLIMLGIWLFFGVACMLLAKFRDLDSRTWFFRGICFGGFAFIYLLLYFDE